MKSFKIENNKMEIIFENGQELKLFLSEENQEYIKEQIEKNILIPLNLTEYLLNLIKSIDNNINR